MHPNIFWWSLRDFSMSFNALLRIYIGLNVKITPSTLKDIEKNSAVL